MQVILTAAPKSGERVPSVTVTNEGSDKGTFVAIPETDF